MGQKNDKLFKENQIFRDRYASIFIMYRKIKKYTQEDVAELVNMDSNSISEVERGNRNSTIYFFYLLIHILSIPKDEVIELLYNKAFLPEHLR